MTKENRMHFVAMAGLHGYMPQYCAVHETRRAAVEDLRAVHELSRRQVNELRTFGLCELRSEQGNEYCEVVECECEGFECLAEVHDE